MVVVMEWEKAAGREPVHAFHDLGGEERRPTLNYLIGCQGCHWVSRGHARAH